MRTDMYEVCDAIARTCSSGTCSVMARQLGNWTPAWSIPQIPGQPLFAGGVPGWWGESGPFPEHLASPALFFPMSFEVAAGNRPISRRSWLDPFTMICPSAPNIMDESMNG